MKIIIETIPHDAQRYPTCGDWFYEPNGTLQIKVSAEMGEDSASLVAIHELIECILCKKHGVSQESVDEFDKAYEANRKEGDDSEPGDDPNAPYRREHFFATNVEALMCDQMGLNFQEHEARIRALP